MKTCPFCAEDIKEAAIVCRYCGRDLPRSSAAPRPARSQEDRVYYSDPEITITRSRVVVGGVTYSTANLTSMEIVPHNDLAPCGCVLVLPGAVMALLLLFGELEVGLAGVLALIAGVYLLQRQSWILYIRDASEKRPHRVHRKDREYLQRIVDAFNQAMADRG